MAQLDLTHAFDSTSVRIALGALGCLLLFVLGRELVKVPARLAVLMATAFVDMVGVFLVMPLIPFYVERLCPNGLDVLGTKLEVGTLNGMIASAFVVAQLVSAPLWGWFSDRYGRRPALVVALAASACAYLVFGIADALWLLFASRLVQGAGGGTVGVIQAYVADSTEPSQRARALGWLSASTNLGVAFGPVLGGWALAWGKHDLLPGAGEFRLGAAAPGVLAAVLCAVNIVFALLYLPESRGQTNQARTSPWRALSRVVTHLGEPASRVILVYAIAIGAFHGVTSVLALFLGRRFGVTEETIWPVFLYLGSISVFARVLVLGRAVDRFGELRTSTLGIVTLATGLLLLAFAHNLPVLALAIGLMPIGAALTFPCVTALLSQFVGAADRGLYMGLQQTYGGIARAAAPLFYGWVFDNLAIEAPYLFAAGFVAATLLVSRGIVPPAKQPPAPSPSGT